MWDSNWIGGWGDRMKPMAGDPSACVWMWLQVFLVPSLGGAQPLTVLPVTATIPESPHWQMLML